MRVSTRPADLEEFSRDSGVITVRPKVAYFAESEGDVAEQPQHCLGHRLALPKGYEHAASVGEDFLRV